MTLERLPGGGEAGNVVLPHAAIAMVRKGSGRRWLTTAGRTQEFQSAPGMIGLCPAGFRIDHARWDGDEGEVVAMQLPALLVTPLLQDDLPTFELLPHLELFDGALSYLFSALWEQSAAGMPWGSMYSEGVTLALLGLLGNKYGKRSCVESVEAGRFGARDRARLHAVISDHLSGDLRIARLADVLSMSPYHFTRMFKATFGQPVHAYVLERKIEAARLALRQQVDRPLAEIASDCGFCSQAHLTEAFRRKVGTTPARWRKSA